MIGPAKIYFIIFGLLTIVGGVIGYVKAGSTASIIAGAISGIALIVAAFLLPGNAALGLVIAAVVSLALAARFIPAFMKTGKMMPAGLMALLSAVGVVMAVVARIKKERAGGGKFPIRAPRFFLPILFAAIPSPPRAPSISP